MLAMKVSLVSDAGRECASKNPVIVVFVQFFANRLALPSCLQRIRNFMFIGVCSKWSHAYKEQSEASISHEISLSPDVVIRRTRILSLPEILFEPVSSRPRFQ